MGDPDKVTEYATYFILVTVMFYYRNQIFITFLFFTKSLRIFQNPFADEMFNHSGSILR